MTTDGRKMERTRNGAVIIYGNSGTLTQESKIPFIKPQLKKKQRSPKT